MVLKVLDVFLFFQLGTESAINAKQVQVKFNQAADASSIFSNVTTGVLNADTVTVGRTVADANDPNKSVTSVTGSLSADGKVLTLTAATSTYFDGTYAVTVSDSVESKTGKAFTAFATTVNVSDVVLPTVKEVVYNTITNDVEVTFSEPVLTLPDVLRLDGTSVVGASFVDANQTKIKFAKPASIASGSTASLTVSGTKDANQNILTPFTGNVVFTNDASALSVATISQLDSNKAKVVFNKSIASADGVLDSALKVILDGNLIADADVTVALDTNDTTKKSVIVTFAGTATIYFYGAAASKTLTFVFADNTITDVFGKTLAATTQSAVMNKDVTGPTFVSVAVSADNATLEVTFNENISATVDPTDITVRKDGVALTAPVTASKKAGTNQKVLVITLAAGDLTSGKLAAGTYSIRLDGGAVTDVHTNANSLITTNVTKSASATGDLTASITNVGGTTPNEFEVNYSHDVTTASALSLNNYTLDGSVLPAGTDIYFKSGAANRTVVIVIPNDTVNIESATTPANARVGVSNVQTSTGKVVVSTSATVLVKDNTAAKLASATKSGNSVIATFSEAILATGLDVTDFVVTNSAGGTVANTDYTVATVAGNSKQVQITFTAIPAGAITVKTAAAGTVNITDSNSLTVAANSSVVAN